MDDFTYEKEEKPVGPEIYVWDNVWWEQVPDNVRPRVLYIGDSISCGIRRYATWLSDEKILFDGFGTSKAVDNEYLAESIRFFGKQQKRRNIIIFNNGLHGFHLNDTEEYGNYYEKMVQFLMEEYPDTPLALVLTTSVDSPRNARVIRRNETVQKIAEKYNLPVIDLYAPSVEYASLHSDDGIHFTDEANEKLAKIILESIHKIIPEL